MRLKVACFVVTAGWAVIVAAAQTEGGDRERRVWSTEFRKARVAERAAHAPTLVGVTLWRLRGSRAADQARVIVHEEEEKREMTPERITANTTLFPNDRLRISIESSRPGYLYVISSERYRDGSAGAPYLIFPSRRIRRGEHAVQAGRLVELPEPENRRPYFTVKRSRADHVAEELLILVTPRPLDGVAAIESQPVALQREQVEAWRKRWGGQIRRIETAPGQAWTKAEQQAAQGRQTLRPEDPSPQALYRQPGRPDMPVVLAVELRLAE